VFASNESYDTAILPFASQINYVPPTKANNCPFKLEVIFCVQGAISPLLGNIYLHYVFDLWAERWRRQEARGDMIVVRYADDLVAGFEHEDDARRFLDAMRERFEAFSLSLHPDKTRLIEFGRHAAADHKKRGVGRPETFAFLGFTFICAKHPRLNSEGAASFARRTSLSRRLCVAKWRRGVGRQARQSGGEL